MSASIQETRNQQCYYCKATNATKYDGNFPLLRKEMRNGLVLLGLGLILIGSGMLTLRDYMPTETEFLNIAALVSAITGFIILIGALIAKKARRKTKTAHGTMVHCPDCGAFYALTHAPEDSGGWNMQETTNMLGVNVTKTPVDRL